MAAARPWRPAVLKMHRWIALSAGLVLVLNACTGLLLLGGRPLDAALNPQLFTVPPGDARVSLEVEIKAGLQQRNGKQTIIPASPPAEPG